MPPKVRALLALGTLTALVAVASLQPLPHVWGQDKEAPARKVEQKAEEKAEEKTEKKSEEPAPVKEGEVKREGRGEQTEKEPMKGEEKAPEKKKDESAPTKEEGRGPRQTEGQEPMKEEADAPRKVEGKGPLKEEGKTPEGRPVRRKGDPEVSKDPVPGRGRPVPEKEMKEPGEGKRPGPDKEAPKGGPIVGFNGGISFDAKNTSKCGKGQICYNYALPTVKTPAGIITGTLEITLKIYQHGSTTPLVFTPPTLMQSGVLADGDHFCFEVDPTTFPGIDLAAGGFDFVASAKFSLNGSDSTFLVGSVPQGVILLKNNDYQIECKPSTGTKGEIVYDERSSTKCGKGQICFNVKRPTMKDEKGNIITATGELIVTLCQNGQPVLSLPGMAILSDVESYCIPIDPANMKGLNCDLGGFDFVATATFTFGLAGVAPTSATVGMRPDGIKPKRNNDYQCECEPGTGTPGTIVYDERTSTTCGEGKICFNLRLPTMKDPKGNIITATGEIKLAFYQGGQAVFSLSSGPLNVETGERYCFPITLDILKKLNCDLGGFDFVATAYFSFNMAGTPDTIATVGSAPSGIIGEMNNDYQCECKEPPHEETDKCCLGKNLVKNGDFEQPGVTFESGYQQAGSLDQLFPGTFSVTNVGSIGKACESWHLPEACAGTGYFSGNVLVVNGQTNQAPGLPPTIWEQTIQLPSLPGVEKQEYRICFRYLPLPQCCFNVPAKPVLHVIGPNGPMAVYADDDDVGCGHLYSATITATPGTVIHLHIDLPGVGQGDGNDLLIDNISMVALEKMPFALVDFTLFADPVNGDGTKPVTLTAPGGLMAPYTWWWSMYDPTTEITTNYPGTSTLSFPGLASTTEDYVFKLQAKGPCNSLGGSKQEWSFGTRARAGKTVEDPNPEPVDPKTVKEGNPEAVKNRKESPALKKRSE